MRKLKFQLIRPFLEYADVDGIIVHNRNQIIQTRSKMKLLE